MKPMLVISHKINKSKYDNMSHVDSFVNILIIRDIEKALVAPIFNELILRILVPIFKFYNEDNEK